MPQFCKCIVPFRFVSVSKIFIVIGNSCDVSCGVKFLPITEENIIPTRAARNVACYQRREGGGQRGGDRKIIYIERTLK